MSGFAAINLSVIFLAIAISSGLPSRYQTKDTCPLPVLLLGAVPPQAAAKALRDVAPVRARADLAAVPRNCLRVESGFAAGRVDGASLSSREDAVRSTSLRGACIVMRTPPCVHQIYRKQSVEI